MHAGRIESKSLSGYVLKEEASSPSVPQIQYLLSLFLGSRFSDVLQIW